MDLFDFNAPVSAMIIFDDSDDETKPIEDIKKEKEVTTNGTSKVEQVQEVLEKQAKNNLLTPMCSSSKTETCALAEHDIERELANNIEYISEQITKHALQQIPLDMPSLEEENKNSNSSIISERDKYEETDSKNNTNLEEQMKRKTILKNNKISKRRRTEELINSDKTRKAIKKSAEKKNICKRRSTTDSNLTDGNNKTKTRKNISKKFNPPDGSNKVPLNKEVPHIESQKQNIEIEKTYMINVEINPTIQTIDQEQSNANNSSHSLNDVNKTVAGYLKGLLDTVSEHMIYILNSHHDCAKLSKTNTDPKLIEYAKNNCIGTRNYFFDLSYSAVVNIIIPRNDDPTFAKNFLDNTIQIGHSKSYNYSYEQMEALYFDMIKWVKTRQYQIQNMNRNKISSPLLVQELQKPSSRPPITHQNNQVKKPSPVLRKNSAQSRLPLENTYVSPYFQKPNQQRQPYYNIQQLQNPEPQSNPPPCSNQNQQYIERSPDPNGNCYQPSRFTEQSNIRHTIQTNLHQKNTQRQHNGNQMQNSLPKQNTYQKLNDNLQQMQIVLTNTQPHFNYNNEIQTVIRHQNPTPLWLNSVNTTTAQKLASHTWQNDVLPPYAQNYQDYQKNISSQNNNQYFQQENIMQPLESNRSSISRDSGFMSPLNFNTSNDVLLPEEQRPQQSRTPLITHVTSLNPNVSLIMDGNCAVCKKVTKQKCLGCFNSYYCSHDCQFLDWKIHQLVCK